jgi:hypothetical protein
MNEPDGVEPQSPADVEREIGHTRVQLALTLNAIERKLNARHLVEKGFDMFKDTFTGGEAVNQGIAMVRANPIPFALFGIGAAWLIASNTNVVDRVARSERIEATRRRVANLASGVGTSADAVASDVAGRVGSSGTSPSTDQPLGHTGNPVVDQPADSRSDGWVHQVSDMANGALRSVRDSGSAAINRAGTYAGDGVARATDRLTDTFERHPLLLGAIGVMAGALVASMLPLTRTEEESIGSARDEFWHKAEAAGQDAIARVREAASRAASRAMDAAADAATETLEDELIGTRSHH